MGVLAAATHGHKVFVVPASCPLALACRAMWAISCTYYNRDVRRKHQHKLTALLVEKCEAGTISGRISWEGGPWQGRWALSADGRLSGAFHCRGPSHKPLKFAVDFVDGVFTGEDYQKRRITITPHNMYMWTSRPDAPLALGIEDAPAAGEDADTQATLRAWFVVEPSTTQPAGR